MSTASRFAHRYNIQTTATHNIAKAKRATNPAMKMAMKIVYAATIWNTGLKTKGKVIGVRLNRGAAASQKMHDEQNDRDHQEEMDRAKRHVKGQESK